MPFRTWKGIPIFMKTTILTSVALLSVLSLSAETRQIEKFLYAGPYTMQMPVMIDTIDANLKGYEAKSLLESSLSLDAVKNGIEWSGEELPGVPDGAAYALHQLGFTLSSNSFAKGTLKLEKAPANYVLYQDGNKAAVGEISLEPGDHAFVIKYLSDAKAEKKDSLKLTFETTSTQVNVGLQGKAGELYTINKMMESRLCYGVKLSPKGDYMLITEGQRAPKQNKRWYYLQNRITGQRRQLSQGVDWMPRTNRYYYTRTGNEGLELVTVDPATGAEDIMCQHLPEGSFSFTPNEKLLLYYVSKEGPKEVNKDVFEVLNPEDRQPRWRDRYSMALYDIETGVLRPLTFGYNSCYVSDISQDGRYALLSKNENVFKPLGEETAVDRPVRPHEFSSLYLLNLETMALDTLINKDGFVYGGTFSPDGSQVLVQGSPEAFNRKGCTLPENVIPSMFDYQAYIIDVDDHEVHTVTRDFDPSISSMEWSLYDGQIYLTCENRDSVSLYRLDPKTGDIKMLPLPEESVKGVSFASQAPVMAWYGQSAMNSDRLYTVDLTKVKLNKKTKQLTCPSICFEDISAQTLEGVQVAECKSWHFTNSNGDDVLCRYYLPVGFDENNSDVKAKYPMITYYYGGCSPTGRSFESSYPWQCWAALGYAVLVVQPSGAAGFGQEWASRHVNTAGVDPARDITEAVREFCLTHAYINKEKVGCCGASYGGFMTQYLQTMPDCPFACAISHAGISDHTTYWGYGYWGYSYSEVSMANSYPWSETDLYVKNSPIYNVDKIHTPILFLHGTKDVNVPINNSIQMFTALKLLGRETALVCVEGEDHGVVEYDKRMAWLKTSLAWFQKYLKDDASWWDAMYPKKAL